MGGRVAAVGVDQGRAAGQRAGGRALADISN